MRIAILADIHSNLEALNAVLADAMEKAPIDKIWCLGDTVGYGPDPIACLDTILSMDHILVAGNHDLAAVGKISLVDFNAYAAEACRWTTTQLSSEHREHLAELPLRAEQTPFTLVHGSSRDPIWEYVVSIDVAQACFDHFTTPYCLVGHSHIPFIYRQWQHSAELVDVPPGSPVQLGRERLIINPGGVGQPRDGDPRASYAIYHTDENSMEFRRVSYNVAATQRKMRTAGLPEYLAERLQYGR
ncbi:MAG: metallophosphoesterase family protein [Chloroflexi bacterium]|nr:metallophosphoesterase family protein [Chloroflexota bacterium]